MKPSNVICNVTILMKYFLNLSTLNIYIFLETKKSEKSKSHKHDKHDRRESKSKHSKKTKPPDGQYNATPSPPPHSHDVTVIYHDW